MINDLKVVISDTSDSFNLSYSILQRGTSKPIVYTELCLNCHYCHFSHKNRGRAVTL